MDFIALFDDSSTSSSSSIDFKSLLSDAKIWIALGVIVALVLAWYLLKRYIKARQNVAYVILKKGQIEGVVSNNEGDMKSKYLTPFIETTSSAIQLNGNVVSSDKLMVNDGPDKLYKISFKLTYDVVDVKVVYQNIKSADFIVEHLNNCLRMHAYNGHVDSIIKTYVESEKELVGVINKEVGQFGIEVKSFNVLSIAPTKA